MADRDKKSTIERDYPGMLLIVVGLFLTLAGADAQSAWLIWVGVLTMFGGVYLGRQKR